MTLEIPTDVARRRSLERMVRPSMSSISTDDLKGLPHILVLKSESELKVIEFTGEDAMERAHEAAQELALKDWPGCITVAVRVRQLCPMKYERMMA